LTCSFLACLIFSFSALFVKLTGGRVPVLEVCLVRSSISAGLTFLLMWLTGINWRLWFGKRSNLRLLFLRGCCGACSMVSLEQAQAQQSQPGHNSQPNCAAAVLQTTYYVALFLLPLGDAVTINLIGPPVTAVFARLLLKEPLG
jgi:drug/metabolite transporter (DMT)-like permease